MSRTWVRIAVDLVLVAGLFVGSLRLYSWSPGLAQMTDGCYSLAVTESLLRDGTVRLDTHLPADLTKLPGYDPQQGQPYHLMKIAPDAAHGREGGFYYGYPLGSSLLSAPAVWYYTHLRPFSSFHPDGTYNLAGETVLHMKVSAVVTALAVVVFYLIVRAFLPAALALLLTIGFATGSMAWSTLARSLWSHTWTVLLTALAVLVLVRLRRTSVSLGRDLVYGTLLGLLCFGIHFVRPQAALSVGAILVFLALWHRRVLLVTVPVAAVGFGLLASWSMGTFGTLLPPTVYSPDALDGKHPLTRFLGLLGSPSRGLLVFCPYLVSFGWLAIVYRRHLSEPRLLLPAGLAIGGYLAMFTAYKGWHGGYCYGPRYFSDVLPWFVLLGSLALGGLWNAIAAGGASLRKVSELVFLASCFAWAGFAHGRGAISWATWEWNYTCLTDDQHIRLISDWKHPQFLAGLKYGVRSDGTFFKYPKPR